MASKTPRRLTRIQLYGTCHHNLCFHLLYSAIELLLIKLSHGGKLITCMNDMLLQFVLGGVGCVQI